MHSRSVVKLEAARLLDGRRELADVCRSSRAAVCDIDSAPAEAGTPTSRFGVVLEEADDAVRLEALAAGEERQLDEEAAADNDGAALLGELAAGAHRAAGGEQIVNQ